MDGELGSDVVLEPRHDIVPNSIELLFALAHFLDNTRVDMPIKVPAFDVRQISSFERYCED